MTHKQRAAYFGVSVSCIGYGLRKLGITRKKTLGYKKRCDEKRATYRKDLAVKQTDGKRIVYVDECGFCDQSFRPYAYAPKGETVLGLISSQRSRKTTMVAARIEGTFTALCLFEGSCNAHRFNSDKDKIADGWENTYTSNIATFTPGLDAEEGPAGNRHPGDGLSVFEEYRGFKLDSEKRRGHKAGHIRTNPKSDKDLFIAYAPLGNIINLPSKVRVIGLNEMYGPGGIGSNNRIDFNDAGIPSGQQTQQRALVPLMDVKMIHPGGVLGRTYNENPPHKVEKIYYFTRAIEQFVRQNLGNENFAQNVLNLTATTITHEIGHGVNLSHHEPRLVKDGERNCIMNVSPVVLNNALVSVNKYYFDEIHSTNNSDPDDIDPNHVEDFRLK